MVAASIANPAAPQDDTAGKNSNSGMVFDIQTNTDDIYNRLYIRTNRALHKLGMDINDFSSYDEMIEYIKSIEKPNINQDELNNRLSELRAKAEEAELIKSDIKYTQTQVVSTLNAGKTVPTQALELCNENLKKFKAALGGKSIKDYIENLQTEGIPQLIIQRQEGYC